MPMLYRNPQDHFCFHFQNQNRRLQRILQKNEIHGNPLVFDPRKHLLIDKMALLLFDCALCLSADTEADRHASHPFFASRFS